VLGCTLEYVDGRIVQGLGFLASAGSNQTQDIILPVSPRRIISDTNNTKIYMQWLFSPRNIPTEKQTPSDANISTDI
jgi:hypothetical protein